MRGTQKQDRRTITFSRHHTVTGHVGPLGKGKSTFLTPKARLLQNDKDWIGAKIYLILSPAKQYWRNIPTCAVGPRTPRGMHMLVPLSNLALDR